MKSTAKTLLSLGLSILVAAAFVPLAWAEGGVLDVTEKNVVNEIESFGIAADAVQAQSDVTATPGWELIGTCEWKVENGVIVLRPAGNGSEGVLPSKQDDERWPWHSITDARSFRIEGRIICGGTLAEMFWTSSALESIEGLNCLDTSNVTDMRGMFSGCSSLKSLDLSPLDTSSVTYMMNMFYGCSSIESLDLSPLDTTNVTNMRGMFSGCSSLKSLDLSPLDTSSVTYMMNMFYGCSSIESLDLSPLDTTSVTNMDQMFYGCSSLKSLDLSPLDTTNVTSMVFMFYSCSSLESLDLSSFDTANVTLMSGMFSGCSSLKSLDLSSVDTANVTSVGGMFRNCSSLELVAVGEKCTVQSELPDKTWYNAAGESFTPSAIPVGVAGTYATSRDLLEPTKVMLNETSKTVSVNTDPFTLVATVTPEWKAGPVTWRSSDPTVATVDADGRVTVHKAGHADISEEFEDSKAVCALTVTPLVDVPSDDGNEGDGSGDGNRPADKDEPGNQVGSGTEGSGETGILGAGDSMKEELVENGAGTEGTGTAGSKKPVAGPTMSSRKSLPQTGDPAGSFAWVFIALPVAGFLAVVSRKLLNRI